MRVIAATNRNLRELIAQAQFREDLFYRLNVIPFFVPPLRERKEDIPLFTRHFLKELAATYGRRPREISDDAIEILMRYSWPGNVRELRNVIERMAILMKGEVIEPEDVQLGAAVAAATPQIDARLTLREARDEFEKQYILSRLREFAGNVSRTADALGVERSNLYRKLHAYGIRVERP